MLITVGKFCQKVSTDLNRFVDELQEKTGRYTEQERTAWQDSFRKLSVVLAKPALADFHMHLGNDGGSLLVEYRLPASSSWCDVVLLGRNNDSPTALILELKHWDTSGDVAGPYPGVITHQGSSVLHPSEQVRGYTEYCRRFHSAVLKEKANVQGCAFLTRSKSVEVYRDKIYADLVKEFPIYSNSEVDQGFMGFLTRHLARPDVKFAEAFDKGTYKQDRGFVNQIATQILDPESSPFVLLENQQLGLEVCKGKIKEVLASGVQKAVIVIQGPPGSGKSVLAAKLWAELIKDPNSHNGNVVITTTSGSQKSNWNHIYNELAGSPAGKGIIKPANQYTPETTQWFGKRKALLNMDNWKANLKVVHDECGSFRCPDDSYKVSIVDEAHGLINPEIKKARPGVTGWPMYAGPQAYHIIRGSQVSVFLMDGAQSFRDCETTTLEDIKRYAAYANAQMVEPISLEGNQYRCGGSTEYIDWLESLLGMNDKEIPSHPWRKSKTSPHGKMILELADNPKDLEDRLRASLANGGTGRLISSYSQKWITKGKPSPHSLAPKNQDFHFKFNHAGKEVEWSKIWNYAPGTDPDYSYFIQAIEGSRMAEDPLSEVGCPYTVRGFDYTYLGVLWGNDFVRRGNKWVFDIKNIHETAWKQTLARAKKEEKAGVYGEESTELLKRLKIAYRIIFSRAIAGIYTWIQDDETREYVKAQLPK
jgi:hypothetical protein